MSDLMLVRPDECGLLRRPFRIAAPSGQDDVGEARERDGHEQLQVLGVGPAQGRYRTGRLSEEEPPAGDVRAVPNLLWQHQARAGETFQAPHHLGGRQAHGKEVAGALACEHGPGAPYAASVPRRSVLVLSISVGDVPAPRWSRGQAGLEVRVDALKAA